MDEFKTDEIFISTSESEELLAANKKAIEFLRSVDFKSLGRTVFKEHLATVSETGKSIGELSVSVEETIRNEEICYYVHAQSHGELDNVPMGTSVTAYISRGVVTLEQTQHEYIKIPNKPLDKKTVLVRTGGKYLIKRVITDGISVRETEKTLSASQMKGFISEGANIILQRIMCLRQEVPETATFLSLDTSLNVTAMTYEKLPDMSVQIENKNFHTLGIQRDQHPKRDSTMTWRTHFLPSGHMANRMTVGSPVRMQLVALPKPEEETKAEEEKVDMKTDLHWQEDMEMTSYYLERKEELISNHRTYISHKPEMRALLEDFCQFVLLRKPDDVCSFASNYFGSFSTREKAPSSVSVTNE